MHKKTYLLEYKIDKYQIVRTKFKKKKLIKK